MFYGSLVDRYGVVRIQKIGQMNEKLIRLVAPRNSSGTGRIKSSDKCSKTITHKRA